jgi:hypothetical protein
LATPTIIPYKCDLGSHTGPLGICKTTLVRSTELEAIYTKRGGVYDEKAPDSFKFEPPMYLAPDGVMRAMVWCPECGEWKRREGYYKDKGRANGLDGICRQCKNPKTAQAMRLYRARLKEARLAA